MGEIDRFFGKDLVKVIKDNEGREVQLKIPTLDSKDLPLIMKFQNTQDSNSQVVAMSELFAKVMRHNYPNITEEDLNKVSVSIITQVLEGVAEANGLKDTDTDGLIDMRKHAQRNTQLPGSK